MKNKIKGLLALVLSVLIGQVWAADTIPEATWKWDGVGGTPEAVLPSGEVVYKVLNKYITLEGIPANSFTFSFWSKRDGENWRNYAGFSDTTAGLMIQQNSSGWMNIYGSGALDTSGDYTFNLSRENLQLLTFVSSGGVLKVYVDGEVKCTCTPDSTKWPSFSQSGDMKYFGLGTAPGVDGRSTGNGGCPTLIGDARIYNTALSEDQVKSLYQDYKTRADNMKIYARSFSQNSNWVAESAWQIKGTEEFVDVPAENGVVEITVAADCEITMNSSVNINKLSISGVGNVIFKSQGSDVKLNAGVTEIHANTTVEPGVASLGSIIINQNKTLTVKENWANVASALLNNGTLCFDGEDLVVENNNTLGNVLLADGAKVKMRASGGNKTYKVSGVANPKVKPELYLYSGQNWGVKQDSVLRNIKIVIPNNNNLQGTGNVNFWLTPATVQDDNSKYTVDLDIQGGQTLTLENTNGPITLGDFRSNGAVSGTNERVLDVNTGRITGTGVYSSPIKVSNSGEGSFVIERSLARNIEIADGGVVSLVGDGALSGVISGNGAIKVESGSRTLSGANTYSGGTTIANGATLVVASANALGTGSVTLDGALTFKDVEAELENAITQTDPNNTTNPTGQIVIDNSTVTLKGANGNYKGLITINEGATLKTETIHYAPFGNGASIVNNGTIDVKNIGTGNCAIQAAISGKGSLTVSAGTLILTGANTYNGATTIAEGAKVIAQTENGATWNFNKVSTEPDIAVNGELEFVSSGEIYRGIAGNGTVRVSGDILLGNTGNSGELSGLSRFKGTLIVAAGKTLTLTTWGNQYDITLNALEVNGTVNGVPSGQDRKPVVIKTTTLSGSGTISGVETFTLADGATLAGAVTVTGNVTIAGALTITHAKNAGDTVITCANADVVADQLTGAPQGLKYVAENGAVKLAVANVLFNPATAESVTVDAATKEAALAMVVIQRPEGVGDSVVSAGNYAAYFTKTATGESGNWTVTVTLNEEVKPVVGTTDDADDAFTVDADGVTITINNYKPGLYYGIRSATELGALKNVKAVDVNVDVEKGKINVDKLTGDSAFYQVVVDVKPFPSVNDGEADEGSAEAEPMPDAE